MLWLCLRAHGAGGGVNGAVLRGCCPVGSGAGMATLLVHAPPQKQRVDIEKYGSRTARCRGTHYATSTSVVLLRQKLQAPCLVADVFATRPLLIVRITDCKASQQPPALRLILKCHTCLPASVPPSGSSTYPQQLVATDTARGHSFYLRETSITSAGPLARHPAGMTCITGTRNWDANVGPGHASQGQGHTTSRLTGCHEQRQQTASATTVLLDCWAPFLGLRPAPAGALGPRR